MPAAKKQLKPKIANAAPKSGGDADPVLKVETWPIWRLKPYKNNPRTISDVAVKKVAGSIKEFGFQQPIVVDKKDVIIVGHTRHKAAESLGFTMVPVVVADLSEDKARAYRLADNRVGEETDWAADLLRDELQALQGVAEFDMASIGFDDAELKRFLADAKLPGDNEPGEGGNSETKKRDWVCQPEDVWLLGNHRLEIGVGDETEMKALDIILAGWGQGSGREAVLEGDARVFSEVKVERCT